MHQKGANENQILQNKDISLLRSCLVGVAAYYGCGEGGSRSGRRRDSRALDLTLRHASTHEAVRSLMPMGWSNVAEAPGRSGVQGTSELEPDRQHEEFRALPADLSVASIIR